MRLPERRLVRHVALGFPIVSSVLGAIVAGSYFQLWEYIFLWGIVAIVIAFALFIFFIACALAGEATEEFLRKRRAKHQRRISHENP